MIAIDTNLSAWFVSTEYPILQVCTNYITFLVPNKLKLLVRAWASRTLVKLHSLWSIYPSSLHQLLLSNTQLSFNQQSTINNQHTTHNFHDELWSVVELYLSHSSSIPLSTMLS